jgi:hypothetical protein
MDYFIRLANKSFWDTWELIVATTVGQLIMAAVVVGVTALVHRAWKGTEAMKDFVFSAFIGIASVFIIFMLIFLFNIFIATPKRLYDEKAREVRDLQIPPGTDPNAVTKPIATERDMEDSMIVGKTIFVSRIPLSVRSLRKRVRGIAPPVSQISDKTFKDCDFIGPAVITLTGDKTFVEGSGFGIPQGAALDSILLLVRGRHTFGVVPFHDCGFLNCRFTDIAFAGTEDELNEFRNSITKGASQATTQPSPTPNKEASQH